MKLNQRYIEHSWADNIWSNEGRWYRDEMGEISFQVFSLKNMSF